MKNRRRRGRADSEALPTIEELIEKCNSLQEAIEKHLKELKEELCECASMRAEINAPNIQKS